LSLLSFVGVHLLHVNTELDGVNLFVLILFYVAVFISVRFLVGFFLAVLFEREKEQQYLTFSKISYLSNFSILIFPLIIINFYINSILYSKFLILTSFLLLLIYYFLQLKNNQKLIFNNLFYFILYLCLLEFAPYIIVYKLLNI
jgi:hypothetical protein